MDACLVSLLSRLITPLIPPVLFPDHKSLIIYSTLIQGNTGGTNTGREANIGEGGYTWNSDHVKW